MRSLTRRFESIIGIGALLLLWWIAWDAKLVQPIFLPPPQSVAREVYVLIFSTELLSDIFITLGRIVISFVFSMLVGVPIGILLGLFSPIARMFEFPVEFFRSLPATALYPLFMLLFGIRDVSKLILVVFAASLIMLVHTMSGVKNCSAMRIKAAKAMRLTKLQLFYRVIFPESLPNIMTGLRLSLSLVLILVIVVEMLGGSKDGIGSRLLELKESFRIKEMYGLIVIVGILGYSTNKLLDYIGSSIIHWAGK